MSKKSDRGKEEEIVSAKDGSVALMQCGVDGKNYTIKFLIAHSTWQSSRMKLKVVCRKLYDYVQYDLKEIAFPSSLPDPPHIKKRRKLTWIDRWYILKEATRIYAASWVRDIGPDLRPDDYKKNRDDDNEFDRQSTPSDNKEPSMLEDLAVAARGGMETLRPALQRIYMTRASAYKDALNGFIEGYQEELKRVMEGEKVDKPHSQDADVKKPN